MSNNISMYMGTKEEGEDRDCITYFFAKNIQEAKKHAKQMKLKNFSKICKKVYYKNKDY